jgi:D-threo-aldose 1-dehydrogenase
MTLSRSRGSLGLGCAGIGNLYAEVSNAEAAATLAAAVAGGIAHFDTAPYYGHGLSEARLGAFLRATGADIRISTKVGRGLAEGAPDGDTGFVGVPPLRPYFDYSRDGVLRQVDESLRRLGLERVDALLVHDIGRLTHGGDHAARFRDALEGAIPALLGLKSDGVTRAIGIGVNEVAVCLQTLAEVDLDCILLAGRYTLLEQTALDELLPLCVARGVEIIVGGPFNSGVLAGGAHYDYGAIPAAVGTRVAALAATCSSFGVPLAAAALQFPLAHPAVVRVIPGARSAAEVEANLALMAASIPDALWAELKGQGLLRPDAPVPGEG